MKREKVLNRVIIFIILTMFAVSFNLPASAASLSLGEEVYNFKAFWFRSNQGRHLVLDAGYGLDHYSGLGIRIVAPANMDRAIMDIEYQYIPEDLRDRMDNFNYAFKFGAATSTLIDEDMAFKTGFVIENELDYQKIYLDANLYLRSLSLNFTDMLADIEFGISKEISPGIEGIFGYKALATPEDDQGDIRGVKYGIEIAF